MAIAYLGIGSNLGNRRKNIEAAVRLLEKTHLDILKTSTIIESAPMGGPKDQGRFLNGVLKIETEIPPEELLKTLKQIEKRLGRTTTVRNGPRTIDLDILLYNHRKLQTPQLTIPHPRMFERDFVMHPLKEIEPQLVKELFHAHC